MAIKLDILDNVKNKDAYRKYTYADLHLDLQLSSRVPDKPTGASKNAQDLKLSYDVLAIYNSIKNIFNTKKGQKILTPNFGLDLEQYLFDNITKDNAKQIGKTILEELPFYEPRITVENVSVIARPDANEYKINISIIIPSLNNRKDSLSGTLTETTFTYN
jgi:hypothetical protein